MGFEHLEGGVSAVCPMAGPVTVNNSEAYTGACLAGLGLIQVPLLGAKDLIESGRLVRVLDDWPAPSMPVTLLYAHRRQLSKRVRVVMGWLAQLMADQLR